MRRGYREIPEAPNYFINKSGKIYNFKRKSFLKSTPNDFGYPRVGLYNPEGKQIHRYVHRLIYEAWVKKIPEGLEIHHVDYNLLKPHLSKLQLVTKEENLKARRYY